MLEMSFLHYMYTYMIEALKPQPSLQELKKINVFKKFYLVKKKEHIPFVPERGNWQRRGLPEGLSTNRVLHKIGDQEILIGSC